MENVIATLPQKLSPAAVAEAKPDSLATGHVSFASDLVNEFTNDTHNTTRIALLTRMASQLTCEQFKEECKKAQEIASTIDAASGFTKPEGSKGADQYGPVRRVLNQRLSEAKQLFGVFKQQPELLKEKGYGPALSAARQFLDSKGIKWDGSKAPTDEQKAAKATSKALTEVMHDNPQQAGETLGQWMLRCEGLVQNKLEQQQEEKKEKAFEKLLKDVDVDALMVFMLGHMDEESLKSIIILADKQLENLQAN